MTRTMTPSPAVPSPSDLRAERSRFGRYTAGLILLIVAVFMLAAGLLFLVRPATNSLGDACGSVVAPVKFAVPPADYDGTRSVLSSEQIKDNACNDTFRLAGTAAAVAGGLGVVLTAAGLVLVVRNPEP